MPEETENMLLHEDIIIGNTIQDHGLTKNNTYSFPKLENKVIECLNYGKHKIPPLNKLYHYSIDGSLNVCSKCLSIFPGEKSLNLHVENCSIPFAAIYSEDTIDGKFKFSKITDLNKKQNLCLISMLFIKSKTLFFDVKNYDFYILYNEEIYGYYSVHVDGDYSLNCFTVFPCFQGMGWGTLLLDFSQIPHPSIEPKSIEKPYSKKAIFCFRKYWKYKVIGGTSINQISRDENLTVDDVIIGLEQNGFDFKSWTMKNNDILVEIPRLLKYKLVRKQ